jgi:heme/copper-type cytochrome/quinol oxidase subunit 2
MNHRRALRASTDTGLTIFLIMIVGVVLWTTDEVLGWNLLPDWIDKYAQLLVIILSILAAFSVVISIMCSFAVMAESAAEKVGITAPKPSRRARVLIVLGIMVVLGIMFGLHKVDQYRENRRAEAERQKMSAKYEEIQTSLHDRIPSILGLFSAEARQTLAGEPSQEADEALARLLTAIQRSTRFSPSVSVMIAADSPYTNCIITALPERERQANTKDWKYLRREYLTGFPTDWETDAVQGGFEGREMDVPRNKSGVFIDTRLPSSWGTLSRGGQVVGIVMLRGSM